MAAVWKGVISFGLVSIPVSVFPAVRKRELKLRMVRKSDLSPIKYKRVAEADEREVPYDQVVKAYEYEKGEFVPLEEEDFKQARAKGVQSIEISDFVAQADIDPVFFDKAYFLQPEKGGDHAYALLRAALVDSGMVGIAKVVIRSKQHLAALRPKGQLLVLELLHFCDELVDAGSVKAPAETNTRPKEMDLARALIGSMTAKWAPEKYKDDYGVTIMQIIEEKLRTGKKAGVGRAPAPRLPGNVVNVMEMLEKSLQGNQGPRQTKAKPKKLKKAA